MKLIKLWSLGIFLLQGKPTASDLPPRVPSPEYASTEVQLAFFVSSAALQGHKQKCVFIRIIGNWKMKGKAPAWTWGGMSSRQLVEHRRNKLNYCAFSLRPPTLSWMAISDF